MSALKIDSMFFHIPLFERLFSVICANAFSMSPFSLSKIAHIFFKPGFLRRRWNKSVKQRYPNIVAQSVFEADNPKAITVNNKPIVKPRETVSSPKQSMWRKMVLILNIHFGYYYYYYSSMTNFMVDEGIKFKPDIIHANDLDTLWAGWQIKKKTGAKLIYDAHEIWTEQGLSFPKLINYLFKVIEKYLFRKIDHFITINESIAKVLDATYHFQKNLKQTIIYNCPRYQKCEFRHHNPEKIVALYQGRYGPNRGLEQIATAAKYLNPGIEIHFRGSEDEKILGKLKKIAKNINRKNVIFHPPVEMKDLVNYAKTADIGLIAYLPVHIDNELCMPNKVFEYMMAGLALAVSDLPELRRLVKEYNHGTTFNPYDPKDIAKKINQLAKNNLFRLRQNSLKAAKICNWENEEIKLKKIYKSLIDEPS